MATLRILRKSVSGTARSGSRPEISHRNKLNAKIADTGSDRFLEGPVASAQLPAHKKTTDFVIGDHQVRNAI
jgi:hypothetical protein